MQNKKITYLRRWWINDQIKIQLHYSVHTDVKVSTAWFIPLYRTLYIYIYRYSRWPLSSSDPTTPFPPTCAWRRSHNSLTRFTLQTKHKSQRRAFSSPTTGAKIDSSLYIYIHRVYRRCRAFIPCWSSIVNLQIELTRIGIHLYAETTVYLLNAFRSY